MFGGSTALNGACRFPWVPWARLRPVLLAVGLVASLSGCKGGGEGDALETLAVSSFSGDVLSSYFVQSFTAFEDAAMRLRENTARYTFQRMSWSFAGTEEYYRSYPLASARIEYAHAAGLTGEGQTVSVVDSGFLTTHETLEGKTIHAPGFPLQTDDHGTAVASVLAGFSDQMIGVAPGADLAFGEFHSLTKLAAATREATRLEAVAQNNSWGYPTTAATPEGFNRVFGTNSGAEYLAALDAYARDGVVVFAVTNEADRSGASLMEALPALRPSLEPGWLAVMNAVPEFDEDRVLSAERISAACLEAARWCLAADGSWTAASSASPTSYEFVTGSSFAAPQVSGALALLGEAFPQLTPHDLRIRLLASADNSFFQHDAQQELVPGFFHGYDEEFGHGFLDVRAALLPIGTPTVRMNNGDAVSMDAPLLISGSASGDAMAASLAQHEVLVTDSLAGDFLVGAETLVGEMAAAPLMEQRLALAINGTLKTNRLEKPDLSQELFEMFPSASFEYESANGGPDFEFMFPAFGVGQANFGLSVTKQWRTPWGMASLGASALQDDAGLLGVRGGLSDGTLAGAVDIGTAVGLADEGFFSVRGRFGITAGQKTTYSMSSSTSFDSYALEVGKRNAFAHGDRLTLAVEMPTALTSGTADVTLPVARAGGGELMYQELGVQLSPQSREMNIALRYQTSLGDRWEVMVEAMHSTNRGHINGVSDTGGVVGFSMAF